MSYWWCLEHKATEQGLGCGSTTRLGPYDTAERAASALKRINAREADQVAKDQDIEKKWGKKGMWF
jgi:hypothetical protein